MDDTSGTQTCAGIFWVGHLGVKVLGSGDIVKDQSRKTDGLSQNQHPVKKAKQDCFALFFPIVPVAPC